MTIPHNLDGRDLPPAVRELAAGRDPLAIVFHAVRGAVGSVPSPGPGTDRRHVAGAWAFLCNAVEHYIAGIDDTDLARAVRDLTTAAGEPKTSPHCRIGA